MQKMIRRSAARLALSFALAALTSVAALAANVDTRLVVPGGTATTSKILPGQTVMFEVRVDAPDKSTVGTAYRLAQTNPVIANPNFFFSITGRSTAGSPYNDASSGVSDAAATASTGNRLDPDNDPNLGKNTTGLVGVAPGTNILASTITLTSEATTPLGTYRIQPTVGSFATEVTTSQFGTDWPMDAAFFDVVVGQTLTVNKTGTGSGTVTANSGAINCGSVCSDIYPGTVILTAQASPGSTFTGWSGGGCSGTSTCTVTVTAATTVTANFNISGGSTPPSLNKAFSPTAIASNGTSVLTFTITNSAQNNAAQTFSFTDNLPSGLQVASTPGISNNCTGGTVTAAANGGTISVAGATVGATTSSPVSCTISVNITNKQGQTNASCASNPAAFTNAGQTNTTGINNISGLNNLNDAVTQSCVTVAAAPQPTVSKAFSPTTFTFGGSTVLTFTVTNPSGSSAVSNVGFVDTLPSGLVVATPNSVGGTCANAAAATTANPASSSITVANLQVPAGQSTCTVTVNITNASGQTNSSCASSPAAFTNGPGNVTVSNAINGVTNSCVTVTGFALAISKVASSSTALPNSPIMFTMLVTNNGTSPADGSLLTDPAITGFTATGVTCTNASDGGVCPAAGNVTLSNLQGPGIALTTFPAGATITFQLTGTFDLEAGSVTNVATISTPPGVPLQTQSASAVVSTQSVAPTNIPTLSEWMLALLGLMLGAVAMRSHRRRL